MTGGRHRTKRQSPQDRDAKIAKMKDGRTMAHKAEHRENRLRAGAAMAAEVVGGLTSDATLVAARLGGSGVGAGGANRLSRRPRSSS